jgi:histidinol-phosphate aminotransferase
MPLTPRPELGLLADYSTALASAVPVRVRASSNEARDGLSPAVRAAVVARLESANRYPQLGGGQLAAAIAAHLGVAADQVAAGDGSLSLLNYVLLAYCRPGASVVHAWRSYEAYPICIRTAGAEPVGVANLPDGSHDLAGLAAAIGPGTAAVILCSPNNPTGTALSHTQVADFLGRVPDSVLVVLDEAYLDFCACADPVRSLELLAEHANLVVLRTFSKAYGLAGLRVGHLVARAEVVRTVRRILPPFAVNALAEVAAVAALADPQHRAGIVADVVAQRAEVMALLDAHGIPYAASEANFVWLPLGERSTELGGRCAELGISTRVFAGEGIRITVGEPGLLPALSDALAAYADAGVPATT